MARGYPGYDDHQHLRVETEYAPPPSRPTRRRDTMRDSRGQVNYGYSSSNRTKGDSYAYQGGHYAESPIQMPTGERNLEIVSDDVHQPTSRYPESGSGRLRRASSDGQGLYDRRHYDNSRRSSHLQRSTGLGSRQSRMDSATSGPATVSKVTRSRSLTSRPAGIKVYHPPSYRKTTSEIYPVQARTPSRPATRMSTKSGKSHATSAPGRTSTKAGVVVETMSAPNPFCPNTRGVCCLLVLVNLALILVAIGFIIVLQLFEPAFVWNLGIVILVCGFLTFFAALVYCMCICQEAAQSRRAHPGNGELYWTHHWQKNITIPEIQTKSKQKFEEQDRFPEDDLSDTSSRDYPKLYLESDYGQRTDREADFETEQEGVGPSKSDKYSHTSHRHHDDPERGRR